MASQRGKGPFCAGSVLRSRLIHCERALPSFTKKKHITTSRNRFAFTNKVQSDSQLFHGPAPRALTPPTTLRPRLRRSRSNTSRTAIEVPSTMYSLPGGAAVLQRCRGWGQSRSPLSRSPLSRLASRARGRPPRRVELFGALSPAAGPTTGSIIGVAGMRARKVSPAFSPSESTAEYLTPSTTNSILRTAFTPMGTTARLSLRLEQQVRGGGRNHLCCCETQTRTHSPDPQARGPCPWLRFGKHGGLGPPSCDRVRAVLWSQFCGRIVY